MTQPILRDKHGQPLQLSDEPGHRTMVDWMGTAVLSLEDLLRPGLWAVAVGINPAPVSVARGHYYQGRLGQRFLGRLGDAGMLREADAGWEDDAAFAAGIGFTDVIKRPTTDAKELRREEYEYGRMLLVEKVERARPELIVFPFKAAAEAVFGRFSGNGFVPGLGIGSTEVFVMPSPYGDDATTRPALTALAARIRARGSA